MRFLLAPTSVCLFLGCLISDRLVSVGGEDACQRRDNVGGRECSKRCYNDRDCVSSRKKCVCDGVCGMSCINLNLRCTHLEPTIPHGRVDIVPYNRFGAVAKYTCNEGYTLFGRPMRVCQGDETWSDSEPKCEINQVIGELREKHECGLPPVVHHASHNGDPLQQTYPLGSHLVYECHQGFIAKRESVYRAWCVGAGVWVGPNMTCTRSFSDAGCPKPPAIQDGTVEVIPPFQIGGKVRYACNLGYHLIGPQERTCQSDGTWDLHPPTCERDGDTALTGSRYRPSPVVCGPPPVVEHATHSGTADQMQYPAGSKLLYTCDFGYYNKGIPNAVCQGSEGTWLGPMMDCVARDCGAPGEIENGYRDPGYRFVYPTRVTFHCNEGYELIGRAFRECQANGEWTGSLPKCEPITCTELGPPLHGTMIGSGRTYGSVIRFVCNEGYKVVGSAERTCQADRMWSGQEAHCEEIDCGVPGPLWNGYLDGHRTTVGAVYFFRCHVRTKFEGVSFSTQCMENGQWSHPPPKCMGQCAVPAIMNGSVQDGRPGVFVDHGTEVRLTCNNGRVLNDTSPVRCVNGTWTVIPRCIPAPCRGVPPLIENGHRIFFGLHHGDRARYFCFEGYKLHNNNQYLTCEFGQWNGPRPFCEENYCPNPGQIINGKVFKKGQVGKFPFADYIISIEHGERLEYECHRGYKLVGPRGAACVNGRWSPDMKPQCIQSRHPILHKLWRPIEENESVDIYG